MVAEGIFLVRGEQLVVLEQRAYESEALLQEALARFPDVLAGSTTGGGLTRQLLLVKREMGVPKADGAGSYWSLDHLFLDTDGIPVIVEVKRSSDSRIRREVIGQMLDYAANGVRYWPVAELRSALEITAAEKGISGDDQLREFSTVEPEEFWRRVEDNLKSGRIRMVFVADHLPSELVRVIEFLNEQMSPAEVLGVEVPQFVGDGHQVLVPRVIGRTSAAVAAKQAGASPWDEDSFLSVAADRHGDAHAAFFRRLFKHVSTRGVQLRWGRGTSPGVSGWYLVGGEPLQVWTANAGAVEKNARAYLYFWLPDIRGHLNPEAFTKLVDGLAEIPAYAAKMAEAARNGFEGRGSNPMLYVGELLKDPAQVDELFAVLDDFSRLE